MMELELEQNKKEVVTFIAKNKVVITLHGVPNFEIWAKKMIGLYNAKLSTSAS
ncbi:hypothetical protein [Peribacillus butanolivorans]|uniref:hypothetical protein n=1 Tax=Peribacillus butanolivorans TaxID=421767 RepID=UPI003672B4ED